jgi:hypothetical protein
MTDLEIRAAMEKAAEFNLEAILEKELPAEESIFRLERLNRMRDQLIGMITLSWTVGYEMGWQVGRKELLGDGETVPDPEDIAKMQANLKRYEREEAEARK